MKTDHFRSRLLLAWIAVVWLSLLASPAGAQVNIHVGIQLPPPLVFSAPPQVIVLPETYVYVVPDIDDDVFFVDGWWWRPWQGHWYRSQYYDRGWGYYSSVPSFYREVPQEWRHEYRDHQWRGRPWTYERMPHEQVEHNWNTWKHDKHWEHHQTWGVQGLDHRSQEKGHQLRALQSEHHRQQPHVERWEHHRQQRQAREQESQHQSHGNQEHGDKGHKQHKSAQPRGGKHDKQ